jgi:hypothetical protein
MSTSSRQPVVLRTAAVWGTTVLAVRDLRRGQSLEVGDDPRAIVTVPLGATMSPSPIRAVGKGWEVDATGTTGGVLSVRGRQEDPAALGRSGAPIPIVAGDHGLLQYGSLAVFFQFAPAAPAPRARWRIDWLLVAGSLFSLVTVGGGLALLRSLTTPRALEKPVELRTPEALAVQFMLEEPPAPLERAGSEGGAAAPPTPDPDRSGGGKKSKGTEGRTGARGVAENTRLPGERRAGLGAMSEVLASEVGAEVQKTLGSIASVAEALGGLRADNVVLGRGAGLGFRGSGSGGGGDTDGVPFGAGTLDTGWGGAARGGGAGSGSGGPGRGGTGTGTGAEPVAATERKVAGGGEAKSGQGLTPAQIQRVVMSRYGAFRACYESAAAREPGLQGGITVSWMVTPGGTVSGARIASSSLNNARVEGCILRQFARLHFPTADKPTGASYPFLFKPGKN